MNERGNKFLRNCDYYLGIPLVFLLGLVSRKRKFPSIRKNMAILATGAIGDSILLSAVIKDLMSHQLADNVTLFCTQSNRAVFTMFLPEVKMVSLPISNPFASIKIIRKQQFDLFVDFGPWPRINALLSRFSRSSFRVGFQSLGQHRHFIYDKAVRHSNTCHEIDNMRRIAESLGVSSHSLPALDKASPDESNSGIVLHMFPSGYKHHYKEWSTENWLILINKLTKLGYGITLTGGPLDEKAAFNVANLCHQKESIQVVAGKTSLRETAEILRKASLVLSVNTGIMHLAAALNQNVIALNGPTSPLRWGPLCDNKININATTKGAGCLHLGFEYDDEDPQSLDSIQPSQVLEHILDMLQESKKP